MVKLTDAARKIIKEQIGKEKFLRLSIKGGGCSGYSYNMDIEDKASSEDIRTKDRDIPILIDQKSSSFLQGLIIDYGGPAFAKAFKFSNPNAQKSCGCGTSFSV